MPNDHLNPHAQFALLPGGWFLDESSSSAAVTEVALCDGLAKHPDIFYGPLAWKESHGPGCARKLLVVQMRDYDAWADAHDAWEFDEGPKPALPSPWPGIVRVSSHGVACGLAELDRRVLTTRAELLALVEPVAARRGVGPLTLVDADERLRRLQERFWLGR